MSVYPDLLDRLWRDHAAPRASEAPSVVSVFSGAGIPLLGYTSAGFRPLLAVDRDQRALDVLRLNFPDCPIWCGDVRNLAAEEVLRITGLHVQELDLLDGSPPCEGFNTLGRRDPDDQRNPLTSEFARLVLGLQPRVFVLTNLPLMTRARTRNLYASILQQLQRVGYQIGPQVVNAADYRTPQLLQRLIVIGVRNDLGLRPTHPAPVRR